MTPKNLSDCGYTMIEIILTILILGILMAVAIPRFIRLTEETDRSRCAAERGAINSALMITYNALNVRDPAYVNWLATVSINALSDTMFATRHIPVCPRGGTFMIVNGQTTWGLHGQ